MKLKDVREDTITMEWSTLKIICPLALVEPSGLINLDIWMDSFKTVNHTGGFYGLALREYMKVKFGKMEFMKVQKLIIEKVTFAKMNEY
jgi:hypothetical protein